ncbi:type I restriction enzyme S subunit [Sphaerotilus sulfidivorans]|uniref:Restriction endonuclease subunit S n=1 Tax=Sphaerotilus sulfidivorans TaxID=639200 RepID=A0A5C1Q455_9BURK|nr:restriction endonuclease subunit S [Sphaerotilus sulfidivorans]NZD47521.1 restriction endonuclease subunit S [Sphaerotilus sulfidivorans]QEN02845.1 restriction endonuclease subunit S [Sphaerotilus sulfidivorans]
MIAGLKPYADYMDSGLPWLGQVPAHWKAVRNSSLFGQRTQTGYAELPILEVSLKTGVQVRNFGKANRKQVMSDPGKYKRAAKGDLAYNTMRMWQGALGVCPVDGLVSPAYVVARPYPGVEPRYFAALFRTDDYMAEIDSASRGIVKDRNRLYWDQFKQMQSPCPPLAEQAAIVKFLDWANGRLDRTIRAKRKVIALLMEQKQVIVRRAITHGLDSSALMKSTGVPWLGDIPRHWSIKRFKFLAKINSGQVDPRKFPYRDMVLIAPNHIESGSGRLRSQQTAAEQGADSGKYLVSRGQIVYSKIRPNLRKAIISPSDCLCSADMYPITPKQSELLPDYLLLLLLSQPFTKFAVDSSMRVAMPKVNREALADCPLWYPSISEQADILKNVASENQPIDDAINRLNREINLLREYRTRLIADVVTGKLDVREAAAPLPDEAVPEAVEDIADDTELEDEEAIA